MLNATSSQWVTKTSATTIAGTTVYYSNSAYPVNNISELYTINYYDDYSFDNDGLTVPGTTAYSTTITTVKGLATGSKVKVLGTSNWITSVTGYDQHRRAVWSASKNNYLGTTDIIESELQPMTAWLTKSKTTHKKTGKTDIVTIDTFTYDHSGKLLTHNQKINSHPEQSIAVNEYDALGQLVRKKVGGVTGGTALQVVDYTYNIRGWLKGINDVNNLGSTDFFGFKLSYNDPSDITKALFNGNISQTEWKTASINPVPYNKVSNKYTYTYDALNRITTAIDNTGNYDEFGITYDKNGNILNLQRDGKTHPTNNTFGLMDNLTYTYANNNTSNKLIKVEDASTSTEGFKNGANTATEYTYDVNGNMTRDDNKGITNITYNHLNLPTQVTMTSGTISYIYDATGVKQRKIVSTGVTTDYAGNYVYENGNLQFFNQPEGYVEPVSASSTTFVYVYQYKDHLGNIRLSYKDISLTSTPSLQLVEENNYYPFGLKHKGYNNVQMGRDHKFGFGNKEEQEELGLAWIDITARNYDPALGRWMNVDPLADKDEQVSWSPYCAFNNDPINKTDPDGQLPVPVIGALIGAVVDIAIQAIEISLDDTKTAKDFSWTSVGVSAVAGATGAGLTSKLKKVGTFTKLVVEAGTDAIASAGAQLAKDGKIDGYNVVIDAFAGQVAGNRAGDFAENKFLKSGKGKKFQESVNQHKNAERGKSNTISKSKADVKGAENNLTRAATARGFGASTAASGAASTTINEVNKKLDEKKKKSNN